MASETGAFGNQVEPTVGGLPASAAEAAEGMPATAAGRNWLSLPREFAASILAILTVPISLGATHFPPWAVFVSWAGTFAAGGPKPEVLRKIAPVQPLGSVVAMLIVLSFNGAATVWSGWQFTIAQMVILFVLNSAMIGIGRVVGALSFVPGMFLGFASYFATYYGGFGLHAQNAFDALWAAILMNALGVLFAWLNIKFMRKADQHH